MLKRQLATSLVWRPIRDLLVSSVKPFRVRPPCDCQFFWSQSDRITVASYVWPGFKGSNVTSHKVPVNKLGPIFLRKKHVQTACDHTCQLSPVDSELPILGGTPPLPPYFATDGQISLFCWIFKIFLFNYIKLPTISPIGNCYKFWSVCSFTLKVCWKCHFLAFSTMKFSKSWQVSMISMIWAYSLLWT